MNRSRSASPSTIAIWVAMIAVYVAWGSTYLAIRYGIQTIPPFLMAGIRFLIAGGALFIWRRMSGDPLPSLRQWRSSGIIGLLLLLGGNGGVVWAEQRVVSGIAALMVASAPLWMVLFDLLLRRKSSGASRPGWISVVGVLLGFAGIAILISPGDLAGARGQVDPVGAAVLTLAAFLWAAGSLYSRRAELPSSPLMGTSMEMLTGSAALLLVGTFSGEWSQFHPAAISTPSLFGLAYLIVGGSLIGYSAYTWLLRVAPTTLVSTYAYVNPIVAIFIGNLIASEPITLRVVIAALIIVGAVMLITFTQPLSGKKQPVTSKNAVQAADD